MHIRKQAGFTVIELLIVISVIGILATITIMSFNNAQARTRDAARKNDLAIIQDALKLYYLKNNNWVETGSGCGSSGNGAGYFSHINGTTYLKSVSNCLQEAGFIKNDIVDPTGGTTSTRATGYAYMKYHCGSGATQRVYVYAKLETAPQDDLATDSTCNTTLDTSYGMNYYVQVK